MRTWRDCVGRRVRGPVGFRGSGFSVEIVSMLPSAERAAAEGTVLDLGKSLLIRVGLPSLSGALWSFNSGHAVHSYRGTFATTTGVNVVDSSGKLYLAVRHKHTFNIHEAPQWKQRWAKEKRSLVLWSQQRRHPCTHANDSAQRPRPTNVPYTHEIGWTRVVFVG